MPGTVWTSESGDARIDGLIGHEKWAVTNLTYSFPTKAVYYLGTGYDAVNGFQAFDMTQRAVATAALTEIAKYTNLSFSLVTESSSLHGDLRFAEANAVTFEWGETAPLDTAFAFLPTNHPVGGDAWFNHYDFNGGTAGTYDTVGVSHEIGHAMGLEHPHEGGPFGAMPEAYDSLEYTVMTYRSYAGAEFGFGNAADSFPETFMMLDIAALQHLYGADFTTNGGNNVYAFSPGEAVIFRTIWDGNGYDVYDFSTYASDLEISLKPGSHSSTNAGQDALLNEYEVFAFGDEPIYAAGNVYNALLYHEDPRSLIEEARGGSGNDAIEGNLANNLLAGNKGNDSLWGLDGNDKLNGGAGNDTMIGGAGVDTLAGAAGNDVLDGGAGNDILDGGVGLDRFVFSSGGGTDRIKGFLDNVDTVDLSDFEFADVDTALGYAVQAGSHVKFTMPEGEELWVNNTTEAALVDDILVG